MAPPATAPPPQQYQPSPAYPPYFGGPPPRRTGLSTLAMVVVLVIVVSVAVMGSLCAWSLSNPSFFGNNQKNWGVTFNDMYYTSRVGRAYAAPTGDRYFVVNFALKNLQNTKDSYTVGRLGLYLVNASSFFKPATCTDGVPGNFSRTQSYSIASRHNVTGSLCFEIPVDGVPQRLSQRPVSDATILSWQIDASKIRQHVNHPPGAKATWDEYGLLNVPSYFFGYKSSDPEGTDYLDYNWTVDGTNMKANGQQVTMAFDKLGNYTVRLTVTDEYGASSNDTLYITIVDQFKLTILAYGRINDPGPTHGDVWVKLEMKNLGLSNFVIDSSNAAFYVKDTNGTSHPFAGFNQSSGDRCIMLGNNASAVWEPYFTLPLNATPSTLWYFTETYASF